MPSFGTKLAVTDELLETTTSLVAEPVLTVTAPDHSLKVKFGAGLAMSVTRDRKSVV